MLAPGVGTQRPQAREVIRIRTILEPGPAVAVGCGRGRVDQRNALPSAVIPDVDGQAQVAFDESIDVGIHGRRNAAHVDHATDLSSEVREVIGYRLRRNDIEQPAFGDIAPLDIARAEMVADNDVCVSSFERSRDIRTDKSSSARDQMHATVLAWAPVGARLHLVRDSRTDRQKRRSSAGTNVQPTLT